MASPGLIVRNIKVWKHVPHFNLSSCNSLYYLHLFWEVCKNQNPMIYAICKEFQEKWSLLQNKSNAYFGKTEFVLGQEEDSVPGLESSLTGIEHYLLGQQHANRGGIQGPYALYIVYEQFMFFWCII